MAQRISFASPSNSHGLRGQIAVAHTPDHRTFLCVNFVQGGLNMFPMLVVPRDLCFADNSEVSL